MEQLSGYMITYHPYHDGTNSDNHSPGSDSQTLVYLKMDYLNDTIRKYNFVGRIKDWARQSVEANVVVAIAPGHTEGPPSSNNFLYGILSSLNIQNMIFCGDLLVRTKEIKKSTDGGNRSQKEHEETIKVSSPDAVKGKHVYIFDDIYTSGATLCACKNVVLKAGAANVKIFAVGKTQSYY